MIMIEHVKMMQILDLDMANAYSWTSAKSWSNPSQLFWNLEDPVLV